MHETEQERFWAGEFGDDYSRRNSDESIIENTKRLFSRIQSHASQLGSIIEFGANIGLNIRALRQLFPDCELSAIEINSRAVESLKAIPGLKVYHQSLLDFSPDYKRDLVLVKGVLIHINPESLPFAYERIHATSKGFIYLCEYYNPVPVEVSYRGHEGKLFKRDFAGEMLEAYPDLKLVDYGFSYHRDEKLTKDDCTWFLLEKTGRVK